MSECLSNPFKCGCSVVMRIDCQDLRGSSGRGTCNGHLRQLQAPWDQCRMGTTMKREEDTYSHSTSGECVSSVAQRARTRLLSCVSCQGNRYPADIVW